MQVIEPPSSPPSTGSLIDQLVSDPDQPVVMFQTRWCGFCHSARHLFEKLKVPYRSIDLDADTYRQEGGATKMRAELLRRTGSRTVPQIFIGGEFIGGATETLAAFRDGSLNDKLKAHGIDLTQPG